MYPSVEALSETRYLNHASLSHALSLRVRASVCAAAAERRNGARANDKLSFYVKLIS